MSITIQLGGPIGQLEDSATGQQVNPRAWGSCVFDALPGSDPEEIKEQVKSQLFRAAQNVIAQKVMGEQMALADLAASIPQLLPAIIAEADVQSLGVRITQLELHVMIPEAG